VWSKEASIAQDLPRAEQTNLDSPNVPMERGNRDGPWRPRAALWLSTFTGHSTPSRLEIRGMPFPGAVKAVFDVEIYMAGKVLLSCVARIAAAGRQMALITALSVLSSGGFGRAGAVAHQQSPAAPSKDSQQQDGNSKKDTFDAFVLRERLNSSIPLTVNALNRFDTHCSDWDWDPEVSIPARELITNLKHQLRDLITLTLQSNPGQQAAELKQNILSQLSSMGISLAEPASDPAPPNADCRLPYGAIYNIEVERPNQADDMIAVTTSLGVVCGEDTSLYVFERSTIKNWKLTLARESNGYKDVSGAQGRFHYAISPRDRSGRYFVVSADVSPWCSSNWQMLRYRAERPGSSAASPDLILSGEGSIFAEDESSFTLAAAVDSFRLEYPDTFQNDGGRFVRTHVFSYLIKASQATRVAPIALKPEEFVDEWMTLPWAEAVQWSSRANIETIRLWYDNLQPIERSASLGEVDFVKQCSDYQWQVGMSVWNPEDYRGQLPDKLYFTVSEKDGAYYMESVGSSENPFCH
jgi:hypothetical protein